MHHIVFRDSEVQCSFSSSLRLGDFGVFAYLRDTLLLVFAFLCASAPLREKCIQFYGPVLERLHSHDIDDNHN
jgi:hypothetical protein